MGNSGALKRRSHGSTADIATVQARSPKNGITPGKIEALNLRLQTRPIRLSHWPTASRQRPKIPDRISERPPRGGLSFCADHVAVHESAFVTKQTLQKRPRLSAIGVTDGVIGRPVCRSLEIVGAALQADGETRSAFAASSIRRRSAAWTILPD